MKKPLRHAITGLIVAATLTSCTLLPQRAAQRTFQLPEISLSAMQQHQADLTIRVTTPLAESPLDGTRLLVMPEGSEIKAYSGARWSKPLPSLVRDQMVDGLRQAKLVKAVISDASGAVSDLTLTSELSAFYMDARSKPMTVVVQLDAQLIDQGSKRVIAARRFSVVQPSPKEPVEEVLKGFGVASHTVTRDMVKWLANTIPQVPGETSPAKQP